MAHPKDVFELDPTTAEPFIRLPKPLDKFILTPPRFSDADTIVTNLNDMRVSYTLSGPPYPYLPEHAVEWLTTQKEITDKVWLEIQNSHADPRPIFGASPVRAIRQVNEDGTQTFLGDCNIDRWGYEDILDSSEQKRLEIENETKKVGDESIVWMIGDYIAVSHHGRGIMTAVLRTLLDKWAIPWMSARHIRTTAHKGNIGSVRVFEKNGFVVEKTIEDAKDRPESKGGGKISLHVLDWKYQG